MVRGKLNTLNVIIIILLGLFALSQAYSQDNGSAGFATRYFVDKFGDPTDKMYLSKTVEGRFSNSATTNSKLVVGLLLADYEFGITLYEYGNNRVKSKDMYVISLKTKNGSIHKITAKCYPELARISLFRLPDDLSIQDIFDGISMTKFYLYEEDREITNYSFSCILPSVEFLKSTLGENIAWIK